MKRKLLISAIILGCLALVFCVGGYLFWKSYEATPQYSLALLVDAAQRGDQEAVNELVDIDAVVNDFLPQITDQAVDLYGRGISPDILKKAAQIATPIMPVVKERAKQELPAAIKQNTSQLAEIPFAALVLGAGRYLDINTDADTAFIKSRLDENGPELRMRRHGQKWIITGVKDDELAKQIAQKIGQEVIDIAVNGGDKGKSGINIKNIDELLRQAEEIFR